MSNPQQQFPQNNTQPPTPNQMSSFQSQYLAYASSQTFPQYSFQQYPNVFGFSDPFFLLFPLNH